MPWSALKTPIPGLLLVETPFFEDARGSFSEIFHKDQMKSWGVDKVFVQDNQSISKEGVLRGLHAQGKRPQAKLVGVGSGEILDVAVDARIASPTWGQWYSCVLTSENHRMLYIPEGFFHGFFVMKGPASVFYKCSDYYDPDDQVGVKWDDSQLAIQWPCTHPNLSDKDSKNPAWSALNPAWDSWRYRPSQ